MQGAVVRRAMLALLVAAALAAPLGGCGGGDDQSAPSTSAAVEKEEDGAVLNEVLSRQTAAVAAYEAALPALALRTTRLALLFRSQEQEHIDGILKALRGLGEADERAPETIEADGLKSQNDYLRFFYEIESATIEAETTAIAKLNAASARALLAGTVANQAQHLVLLRRALGARPTNWVPSPFENGTAPAP